VSILPKAQDIWTAEFKPIKTVQCDLWHVFGSVHPVVKLICHWFTKFILKGCVKTNITMKTHRLQKIMLKT